MQLAVFQAPAAFRCGGITAGYLNKLYAHQMHLQFLVDYLDGWYTEEQALQRWENTLTGLEVQAAAAVDNGEEEHKEMPVDAGAVEEEVDMGEEAAVEGDAARYINNIRRSEELRELWDVTDYNISQRNKFLGLGHLDIKLAELSGDGRVYA